MPLFASIEQKLKLKNAKVGISKLFHNKQNKTKCCISFINKKLGNSRV
jgi:hypothetical protein